MMSLTPSFLIRNGLMLLLTISVAACGFHLRGASTFGFKSIVVSGQTQITPALKKSLTGSGVEVLNDGAAAEMNIELLKEENEKRILSLSGDGLVNEYEVYYRVHFRTKFSDQALWSAPQTMEARRDFSYSDANLLAKQNEEKRLIAGMRQDVTNGILRRLSALKK